MTKIEYMAAGSNKGNYFDRETNLADWISLSLDQEI
jgi:hypothetical protein